MVSLTTAENALKNLYLGVVSEQLNTGINPLLAKIKQTSSDVWGKQIVKLAPYGLNGGVGAGTETGDLPGAFGNNYAQFKLELKNLYGTIEISDKAIRASENSAGAFVNLLNAEMEGLLKASKFNFGRMLYGDGSGKLATTKTIEDATDFNIIELNSLKNVMEGMVIDVYLAANDTKVLSGRRILSIDRENSTITVSGEVASHIGTGHYITVQGSKGLEITGLGAIFSDSDLYGLSRSDYNWLKPYVKANAGEISSSMVQEAIDYIDEVAGGAINFIVCSYDVKRYYLDYLSLSRTNIDYMNLDGGYKALSYNGIPFVSDRFVSDGTMYLLNTDDFKLHQLCDWRWLEGEGGKIIRQKAGTPTYSATLVKYADLICDKPIGQAKISGITTA
ncbi:MAG: phage major capsid protein [Christensenellales bacterium]|jgi:hypothetical protein